MTVVTTLTTPLPLPDGGWTADDLDAFPDDGLRYELVDGVLLVSAAPSVVHQIALMGLLTRLHSAVPDDLRVLPAAVDVRFSPNRQLQPDIVVVCKADTAAHRLTGLPLLAVEVLSPSTRVIDLTLKRHIFEQGGIDSYWVLDPLRPSLTVVELRAGTYVEVARVDADEAFDAVLPFPVRVVPADLLR
jgi:Uma2 family endonuclease